MIQIMELSDADFNKTLINMLKKQIKDGETLHRTNIYIRELNKNPTTEKYNDTLNTGQRADELKRGITP